MNRLFALSLLMLSSSIIYGMQEEFTVYNPIVDIEIKLPEHFKEKHTKESETSFSIPLNIETLSGGECILGISLNTYDKKFEVVTGKNMIDGLSHESLSINITGEACDSRVAISLCRQITGRYPYTKHSYCDWGKKINLIMHNMGKSLEQSQPSFVPGNVEIDVIPRLVARIISHAALGQECPIRFADGSIAR